MIPRLAAAMVIVPVLSCHGADTWLNMGTAERIAVDGKPFDKSNAPFNKVVTEAEMPAQKGRVLSLAADFGASTWIGSIGLAKRACA
jgi:hypothetical protein